MPGFGYTNAGAFKCPHCDRTFPTRDAMRKHIFQDHMGNGRRGNRATAHPQAWRASHG